MNIDKLLVDLEIIGQIKEYDKLAICNIPGETKLFVDQYSMFGSIKRTYRGYNRDNSIKYIEELQKNIEEATSNIICGSHADMCNTMKNSIENAIVGLNNLKITYNDDSEIVARLIILINKIEKSFNGLRKFSDHYDNSGNNNVLTTYSEVTI